MSLRMMECREGGEGEGKGERHRRWRRRDALILARIMCGRMCLVPAVVWCVVGLLDGKDGR